MIKVTAITSGRRVPSSRFRVRQFIEPLRRHDVDVTEYTARPNKYVTRRISPIGLVSRVPGLLASRSSDITWLERELTPGKFTAEKLTHGRRILDVDDALWLTNKSGFSEELASQCDGVIAGNETIAEHYRPHAKRVWLVPTSVDTNRWRPVEDNARFGEWTIGWIGTSSNLPFLYEQEEPLGDFLREHPEAELFIVSDSPPAFKMVPNAQLRFQRWSEDNEVDSVRQMNVGLMPLRDDEWARGKCALKMIQYMAIGKPVIASPVGTAENIFAQARVGVAAKSSQEWYEGLKLLHQNAKLAGQFGAAGRALVDARYSVEKNARKLAEVFREVRGSA